MRIFVVSGQEHKESSLLLSGYLQRRIGNQGTVEFGDEKELERVSDRNTHFNCVLNLGTPFSSSSRFRALNNTTRIRSMFRNRLVCRTQVRATGLPTPEVKVNATSISPDMYPVLGKGSQVGLTKLQLCHNSRQVKSASLYGSTHFVKRVLGCTTYKVHVFAPRVGIDECKPSEFKVIKVSQLLNPQGLVYASVDLRDIPGHYFGAVSKGNQKIKRSLKRAAQDLMFKFKLHWATLTYVVGKDGVPMFIKADGHVDTKEDQSHNMPLYSKAFCEMLGLDVEPLIRKKSK